MPNERAIEVCRKCRAKQSWTKKLEFESWWGLAHNVKICNKCPYEMEHMVMKDAEEKSKFRCNKSRKIFR